jgi:hypothetical protein
MQEASSPEEDTMNAQNAATLEGNATAAQLIAAIYTAKDGSKDYAVRRELNRAAGHIRLALTQEALEDGPSAPGYSEDPLGETSIDGLCILVMYQFDRAKEQDNAGAVRELRRAAAHIVCAVEHAKDEAFEGDKVPEPVEETGDLATIDQELAETQALAEGTVDADA